jgi:hypothetical protein
MLLRHAAPEPPPHRARSSAHTFTDPQFKHPLCYYAAHRPKGKQSGANERDVGIIVMQPILSIPPGNHIVPLTLRQARAGMENLARFHATFWCGGGKKRPYRGIADKFQTMGRHFTSITSRETGLTSRCVGGGGRSEAKRS